MAKLITKKYKNTNMKSAAYGKTYARILHTETLTTDEFARHISDHGSPFDRATISGVLIAACDCLVELTKDSKKIQLGDLGTFYMSAESTGEEDADKYTVDNIKGVHLRFLPNMKHSYALDSRSLRKIASFKDIEQLDGSAKSSNNDNTTSGD